MSTAVIVGEMRAIDWASSAGKPSASDRSWDAVVEVTGNGCAPTATGLDPQSRKLPDELVEYYLVVSPDLSPSDDHRVDTRAGEQSVVANVDPVVSGQRAKNIDVAR